MKISSLIVADRVFIDEKTKKFNIEGIFDIINAHNFPAKHKEFFVAVFTEGNAEEKRRYRVDLKKEEKLISGFDETITAGKKHNFIIRFFDIIFPEPGEYKIEVDVNGEKATSSLYLKLTK